MSNSLVKIRLSNCRKVKPFWATLDDINGAFRNLNEFIAKYVCRIDHINIRTRHHLIFFHQLSPYKVQGFTINDHNAKDKSPRYKGNRKLRRSRMFRTKRYPKHYATNTKVNYWAEYGIYPIPIPKIINSDYKLTDSSGINSIKKDQIEKILIENCFGIFYSNSLNYAKMNGWNIHLHIDCKMSDESHEYLMNVSPVEVFRVMHRYYKYGIKKLASEKEMMRFISNATYGWLKPILPMTMSYIDMNRDFEFGKFIISCLVDDVQYWKEIPMYVNNQQFHLIDEIKSFISEAEIDTNIEIEIIFKTDVIFNESKK